MGDGLKDKVLKWVLSPVNGAIRRIGDPIMTNVNRITSEASFAVEDFTYDAARITATYADKIKDFVLEGLGKGARSVVDLIKAGVINLYEGSVLDKKIDALKGNWDEKKHKIMVGTAFGVGTIIAIKNYNLIRNVKQDVKIDRTNKRIDNWEKSLHPSRLLPAGGEK